MRVTFVGAGNLATNLAVALHGAGHEVAQVFSRTEESAQALAHRVGAVPVNCMADLDNASDIYIISVSDKALEDVATQAVKGREDALFVHTAGSMPMDVIPARRRGVLYPMQSFSKQRLVDFSSIPVFIEASSADDLSVVRQLAQSVSGSVSELSSADRVYLHLAAVFCCNFTNHCYALGEEILRKHGVPFSAMFPLIDEVARKVHTVSPKDAQTGPASRHDWNVVNKHLSMLADSPGLQAVYQLMSKSIADD